MRASSNDANGSDGGWLIALDESRRREGLAALAGRIGTPIEATAEAKPGDEDKRFAAHSFGAVFVEVSVDRDLGEIRVPRVVATYDVGRRLNAKTALSQLRGGIVWGISLALLEHTIVDPRMGRIVTPAAGGELEQWPGAVFAEPAPTRSPDSRAEGAPAGSSGRGSWRS